MLNVSFYDINIIDLETIYDKYIVDSHGGDAVGPYFLDIQNKQRLYITHSEAPHLHIINSQHFLCFCKFEFF